MKEKHKGLLELIVFISAFLVLVPQINSYSQIANTLTITEKIQLAEPIIGFFLLFCVVFCVIEAIPAPKATEPKTTEPKTTEPKAKEREASIVGN